MGGLCLNKAAHRRHAGSLFVVACLSLGLEQPVFAQTPLDSYLQRDFTQDKRTQAVAAGVDPAAFDALVSYYYDATHAAPVSVNYPAISATVLLDTVLNPPRHTVLKLSSQARAQIFNALIAKAGPSSDLPEIMNRLFAGVDDSIVQTSIQQMASALNWDEAETGAWYAAQVSDWLDTLDPEAFALSWGDGLRDAHQLSASWSSFATALTAEADAAYLIASAPQRQAAAAEQAAAAGEEIRDILVRDFRFDREEAQAMVDAALAANADTPERITNTLFGWRAAGRNAAELMTLIADTLRKTFAVGATIQPASMQAQIREVMPAVWSGPLENATAMHFYQLTVEEVGALHAILTRLNEAGVDRRTINTRLSEQLMSGVSFDQIFQTWLYAESEFLEAKRLAQGPVLRRDAVLTAIDTAILADLERYIASPDFLAVPDDFSVAWRRERHGSQFFAGRAGQMYISPTTRSPTSTASALRQTWTEAGAAFRTAYAALAQEFQSAAPDLRAEAERLTTNAILDLIASGGPFPADGRQLIPPVAIADTDAAPPATIADTDAAPPVAIADTDAAPPAAIADTDGDAPPQHDAPDRVAWLAQLYSDLASGAERDRAADEQFITYWFSPQEQAAILDQAATLVSAAAGTDTDVPLVDVEPEAPAQAPPPPAILAALQNSPSETAGTDDRDRAIDDVAASAEIFYLPTGTDTQLIFILNRATGRVAGFGDITGDGSSASRYTGGFAGEIDAETGLIHGYFTGHATALISAGDLEYRQDDGTNRGRVATSVAIPLSIFNGTAGTLAVDAVRIDPAVLSPATIVSESFDVDVEAATPLGTTAADTTSLAETFTGLAAGILIDRNSGLMLDAQLVGGAGKADLITIDPATSSVVFDTGPLFVASPSAFSFGPLASDQLSAVLNPYTFVGAAHKTGADGPVFQIIEARAPAAGFSYVGWGSFYSDQDEVSGGVRSQTLAIAQFVFGRALSASELPAAGVTASYAGPLMGNGFDSAQGALGHFRIEGDIALDVDFGADTIGGQFNVSAPDSPGHDTVLMLSNGTIEPSGALAFDLSGGGLTGTGAGRFFGTPGNAEELGGAFGAAGGTVVIEGVYAGQKQ